jgi:hypothetical protein
MTLLRTILEVAGAIFALGVLLYLRYRSARWNWERRNQDMRAGVQTLFNGKK